MSNDINVLFRIRIRGEDACEMQRSENMKISKNECDKDFMEKKLELSDEKCMVCEYYHCCPFVFREYEDVVYGE